MGKSIRGCFATLAFIAIILVLLIGYKIIPSPFSPPSGGTSSTRNTQTMQEYPTQTTPPSPGYLVVVAHNDFTNYFPCNNIDLDFTLKNTGGQALTWVLDLNYFNGPEPGDPIDNHLHASIGGERLQNGSGGTLGAGQSIDV